MIHWLKHDKTYIILSWTMFNDIISVRNYTDLELFRLLDDGNPYKWNQFSYMYKETKDRKINSHSREFIDPNWLPMKSFIFYEKKKRKWLTIQ